GGGGHPLGQVGDEDGRAALQESRDGPQGGLGSLAGVQPTAHGHGGGRQRERRGAPEDQLQGGPAGPDRPRPEPGGGAAGGPSAVDRRDAGDRRLPPRRRPSGALGAAGAETSPETGDAPDAAASRRQTAAESPEILLSWRHSTDTPTRLQGAP